MNKIAVVIPVREGSSRIKNKVTLPMAVGYNLLEWKIEQLKQVVDPSDIYVSTNSKRLQVMALGMGVDIHDRDPSLCRGHEASFSDVITGIVKDIHYEHIAWATVVVPLMCPKSYIGAFEAYTRNVIESSKNDSLISVNAVKEYLWDNAGPINYSADKNHPISQDLLDIYRVTNGLYMSPREQILDTGYFIGKNPIKFEVPKLEGIDIDTWEDYGMAKKLVNYVSNGVTN